jgi:cytochrome c-type biogenesis protein CcmH/NrfG
MTKADEIYRRARERWLEYIDLSLYDTKPAVYSLTKELNLALEEDPGHVPSLRLLGSLLMQSGDTEDAAGYVGDLLRLVPDDPVALAQMRLLEGGDRNAMLDWVFERWIRREF